MRRSTILRTCLAAVVLSSLAFLACQSPLASPRGSNGPGTLVISFQNPARTVVADWTSSITSYSVTLSSHDGYASLSQPSVAAGSNAAFDHVNPGTWDVAVKAFNGANAVGSGSLLSQTLATGGSPTWTVPISPSRNGTGAFSLTFTFPGTATGIDTVTWQFPNPPANSPGLATPQTVSLTGGPATLSGTVAQAGVTSGAYRMVLTFYRGGTGGTVAGAYSEAVNVWDNVTSSSWLDSTGATQTSRSFAAADFNSSDASLLNLTSSGGAWDTGFSSSTGSYIVNTLSAVTLTPTQSVAGQRIQYQVSGSTTVPLTALPSGSTSVIVALGSTVTFYVTANDGVTTDVYSLLVGTEANVDWSVVNPAGNAVTITGPATAYYGAPCAFHAAYAGTASSYAWFIDNSGVPIPNATGVDYWLVASITSLSPGAHTVMAVAQDSTSGILCSSAFTFTVANNVPATTGLVGEWLMAGNSNDSSGSGYNTSIVTTHGTVNPVADRVGVPGRAYALAGGYLFEPNEITAAAAPFSWAVWFNYSSNGTMLLNQSGGVGLGGVSRSLSVDATTHLVDFFLQNSGSVTVLSSGSVLPNVWHHAVGVYDGSNAYVYVDGALAGSQPYSQGTMGASDFYVGEDPSNNGYTSTESLNDVRVFSRALSAAEVLALYNEGRY